MIQQLPIDLQLNEKRTTSKKGPVVRIFSLGGLGEIGKNMYGIEYKNEIVIIDAGLKFPDYEMAGVDYIIPDVRYLISKRKNIKGLFLTHGHEDHIGAVPFLLRQLSIPIYGAALTIGLLKAKLEEHQLLDQTKLYVIQEDDCYSFENLHVHFFRTMHSIPDAFGIVVDTPFGPIVHTGDFKFDFTPVGKPANLHKIMKLGDKRVLALLADSTNSEREGLTPSENEVGKSILKSFKACPGRILFATFASNVHRLQQVVDAAVKCNRKIFVIGRSMEKVFSIGQELGYIHAPKGSLISAKELHALPNEEVLIICTGSQGEPNAALTRIAAGSHRTIQVYPGDTVIFSSSPIPGNVQNVNRSIDMLMRAGASVIYGSVFDIHTSGHGSQEDLKLMLRAIRPKYFVPIHGEYRMLVKHKRLAEQTGISPSEIFILELGETLSLSQNNAWKGRKIPSGSVFVSNGEMRHFEKHLIEERNQLAQDGVVVVVMVIHMQENRILVGPDVISRGFVYVNDAKHLLKKTELELKNELLKLCNKEFDRSNWNNEVVRVSQDVFSRELGRTPVILSSIHEV